MAAARHRNRHHDRVPFRFRHHAEAAVKNFKGIDFARAYIPMRKRALDDDFRPAWLISASSATSPATRISESATRTLEYSYDAWAVAQVAPPTRQDRRLSASARSSPTNYRNLFDKSVGFIRPRLENGEWAPNFDPTATGTTQEMARCHRVALLARHLGGAGTNPRNTLRSSVPPQAFVKQLDDLFTVKVEDKGAVPADLTGLVGMYAHGNEPSHHVAYLYDYAGAPSKTQERVRDLLDHQYDNQPDGLSGNEDCGQMSAWYVISSLGFYAVNPASGNYVFGTPLFDKATVRVGSHQQLIIEAKRSSAVRQVHPVGHLDGQVYDKVLRSRTPRWAKAGKMTFKMGSRPNPCLRHRQVFSAARVNA